MIKLKKGTHIMRLNIAIITLITVLTGSFAFANNTLGLADNGDGTWNILDIVQLANCVL